MTHQFSYSAIDQVDSAIITAANTTLGQHLTIRLNQEVIPVVGTPDPMQAEFTNPDLFTTQGFRLWPSAQFPHFAASSLFILDLYHLQLLSTPVQPFQQQQLSVQTQKIIHYLTQFPHTPTTLIVSSRYGNQPVTAANQQLYQAFYQQYQSLQTSQINLRIVTIDDYLATTSVPAPLQSVLYQYPTGHVKLPLGGSYRLYPITINDIITGIFKATYTAGTRGQLYTLLGAHPISALSLVKLLDRLTGRTTKVSRLNNLHVPMPDLTNAESTRERLKLHPHPSPQQLFQEFLNNYPQLQTPAKSISAMQVNHVKYTSHYSPSLTNTYARKLIKSTLKHSRNNWRYLQSHMSTPHVPWRYTITSLVLLIAFLTLPILMYIISVLQTGFTIRRAVNQFQHGDFIAAANQAEFASQQLYKLQNNSYFTSYLDNAPISRQLRQQLNPHLSWMQHATEATKHASISAISLQTLARQMLDPHSETTADSRQLSNTAQLYLQRTQYDLTQLQLALPEQLPHVFNRILSPEQYQHYRQQIPQISGYLNTASQSMQILPYLLGFDSKQQIAVLLQNNRELRPTGGFIGSFALVDTYQGQIKDWKIYDVYDADGQLKGHVEPPTPISQHLGEVSWYLRDSNWDPDFPTSAKRINWFLNKEMNVSPDIVIAFDVTALERLMAALGPVTIPEFPQALDHTNIYTLLQTEVEDNFFPGSHRKKDLLTLLTQSIISRLNEQSTNSWAQIADALVTNLHEKNVLLASVHPDVQQEFTELNWSGGFPKVLGASTDTQPDQLAIIEANLGVNKSNAYVQRQINHQISFNSSISHSIQLKYTNQSTTEDKLQGTYKNYLRLFIPPEATYRQTLILTETGAGSQPKVELPDQVDITSEQGYQVIGLLAPVPPKATVTVQIDYTVPLSTAAESPLLKYNLHLFKQPGTNPDNYTLEFSAGKQYQAYSFSDRTDPSQTTSLTDKANFTYNTKLSTDKQFSLELAPLY